MVVTAQERPQSNSRSLSRPDWRDDTHAQRLIEDTL